MDDAPRDDFFIGYLPAAPRSYSIAMRAAVTALALVACLTAGIFAIGQRTTGTGVWDTTPSLWTGVLMARPYPMLRTIDPTTGSIVTALIVREGKCGLIETAGWCGPPPGFLDAAILRETLDRLDGSLVTVNANSLRRNRHLVLEALDFPSLVKEPDRQLVARLAPLPSETIGSFVASGEIVDPKCYFGAMKPGDGVTHRSCAARCISGGIPPVFVSRDDLGGNTFYIITSEDGGPANAEVLPFVGDPIDIAATFERSGDLLFIRFVPTEVRRR